MPGTMQEPGGYRILCSPVPDKKDDPENGRLSRMPCRFSPGRTGAGIKTYVPAGGNPTFFYPFMTHRRSMSQHEAFEHHEHHGSAPCRICSSSVDPEHKATVSGICHHCVYKILILVLIVMVAISYAAWFGIF